MFLFEKKKHLPVVERWLVAESDGEGVAWGLAGDMISSFISSLTSSLI